MATDREDSGRPEGRRRGVDRLLAALLWWPALASLRVALQIRVDRTQEHLAGAWLVDHGLDHVTAAAIAAAAAAFLGVLLPTRGAGLLVRVPVLLAAAAAVITGGWWGEPQYRPALESASGRQAWLLVAVSAGALVALDALLLRRCSRWSRRKRTGWLSGATGLPLLALVAHLVVASHVAILRRPIAIENIRIDLLEEWEQGRAAILEESPRHPIEVATILPNRDYKVAGGNRPGLVLAPAAAVRFEWSPEPGDELLLGCGVDIQSARRYPDARITFEVHVDGQLAATRTLSPGQVETDRRWEDLRLVLPAVAGDRLEVVLRTRGDGEGHEQWIAGFGRPVVVQRRARARAASSPERMNVVLVVIDTLRADHLSCYGYGRRTSPHLDALASQATLYTTATATASWTWPSTASLLTGLYPLSHGVLAPDRCFLRDSLASLPELLQAEGITTAGCSANPLICRNKNFTQGFEVWREFGFVPGERLTREFRDWVRRYGESQFFAYLHFTDPHHPYQPPSHFEGGFARPEADRSWNEDLVDQAHAHALGKPARVPGREDLPDLIDLYDSEIAYVDQQVGELVEILKTRGLWDRTLVIVTSDHGEEFLDHENFNHAWTLFQEQLHVPLLVRDPGQPESSVRDELVSPAQIPATVLGRLGIAPPAGVPLAPPLPGLSRQPSLAYAFGHTERGILNGQEEIELFSVRDGEHKLVVAPELAWERLYLLPSDPEEREDRSEERPGDRERLRRALQVWRDECARYSGSRVLALDDESRRQLEELGYLSTDEKSKARTDEEPPRR